MKWTETHAIPNMEAETVPNIFVNELVARYGHLNFCILIKLKRNFDLTS